MKIVLIASTMLFSIFSLLNAQSSSPVRWTFELNKISETDYEIEAVANINPSWVIYSQFTDDAGPIPTYFTINGKQVKFEEKGKLIKEFDEMFDVEVMKFKEKASFVYKIKKEQNPTIDVSVEYMTCDGQRCLPPAEISQNLKF
ncbi:MAG TPA: protein-disulfide reductase DsbD family protein [Saprospiraceae bacterium]|jgi:thiol:disulfide interchange protein DsbD|nr:cytochrome C biogenesis protein [Saprospiraceae bacterium]MBK9581721.1 cytochrome C biogenesis protein [Saprospiraceae bacterium]HMT51943.1 protein-disulfide reductase DsbD family protein [Saprospiraceae bacterium]HMT69159.1 protein-disulfide reductase DsbD family protein [Saprospiraceae bacterium]HRG40475.1 protein-disulfide reductase DsbD family protein [Saprospiraceae bacterium]